MLPLELLADLPLPGWHVGDLLVATRTARKSAGIPPGPRGFGECAPPGLIIRRSFHPTAYQNSDRDNVVRVRRTRAGPILAQFSDWIETQRGRATPKGLFGQAIEYSRNQWASLVRYLDDARVAIDNGASERAIRPLAIGRCNWLHVGGDGGLTTASVLLSVCASATRHRLNPWSYRRDVLNQLAARSAGDDVGDLLPNARASRYAQTY